MSFMPFGHREGQTAGFSTALMMPDKRGDRGKLLLLRAAGKKTQLLSSSALLGVRLLGLLRQNSLVQSSGDVQGLVLREETRLS